MLFWSISTRLREGGEIGRRLRLAGVFLILCSSSHKMFCSGLLEPCVVLCQISLLTATLSKPPSPSWEGRNQGNQIPAAFPIHHRPFREPECTVSLNPIHPVRPRGVVPCHKKGTRWALKITSEFNGEGLQGPTGDGHGGETHAELDKKGPIKFSPPRSPRENPALGLPTPHRGGPSSPAPPQDNSVAVRTKRRTPADRSRHRPTLLAESATRGGPSCSRRRGVRFSRGMTGNSGSLSCGAREVRCPCVMHWLESETGACIHCY